MDKNKKEQDELKDRLLVEYEDLILEFSKKMLWLLRQEHGRRYQFAVHRDIHDRTIARLEKVHDKLLAL